MKTRFDLDQQELPKQWYNVLADLDRPMRPPLDPRTNEPVAPEALAALFPMACIEQEVSTDRFIDIPDPVLDVYRMWRPTPLHRAVHLERALEKLSADFQMDSGHDTIAALIVAASSNARVVPT